MNINSKGKIERNKINKDKFYTKLDDCRYLVNELYNNNFFNDIDLVIEPSAGCGNFITALNELIDRTLLDFKIIGYDIEPESEGIIQQDFLTLDLSQFDKDRTAFIGNPPFGYVCNLLNKFINKCDGFKRIAYLGTGNRFRNESIYTFKQLSPYYIQKLEDTSIQSFSFLNEIFKIGNITFIWFERLNIINPRWTIYQDNLEKISKYVNLFKPKTPNLFMCLKFKDAGLMFYDKTTYPTTIRNIQVNTNEISLDKFVEIWNASRVLLSDGKLNKYRQVNYYLSIDNFLKNIK